MKFSSLIASALLPLGLLAESVDGGDQSLDPRAISRPQSCTIIGGSTTVNCRRGPATKWSVQRKVTRGQTYSFYCVRSGECVTINGLRNCGWHYSQQLGCYVNGHYTDNRCTLARLGACGGADDKGNANPF